MTAHRRVPVRLFVRRSRYLTLLRALETLRAEYRTLEADLQSVLEDHEGLLYDLERPEEGQTGWGRLNEVALSGMDPVRAAALIRASGLLTGPSGYGGGSRGTTG